MSESFKGPFNPVDAAMPMMRMWTDMATKMMSAAQSLSPETPAPEAARDLRSAMLGAWTDAWNQYLRSPDFLEWMRRSVDIAVQGRKQVNDWLGQMQHEMQAVSRQDLDQLMRAMRHIEQRSVDGLERISDQLDDLAERINCLEKHLSKKNRGDRQAHE